MNIEPEVINEVRKTMQLLLEASAVLNKAVRTIEREHAYAGDPILKAELRTINDMSGDLSAQWVDFSHLASAHDVLCLVQAEN